MASRWYYRLGDDELGPIGFRDLVILVRDGTVTTDDLVREDWERDWRPAATVVGLFHMAGREDVLQKWELENKPTLCDPPRSDEEWSLDDLHELAERAEAIESGDEPLSSPTAAAADRSFPDEAGYDREKSVDPDGSPELPMQSEVEFAAEQEECDSIESPGRVIEAIEAAVGEMAQRESARRPTWLGHVVAAAVSPAALHLGFRWVFTAVVAAAVAWGVVRWSEIERLRFPPEQPRPNVCVFPVWGECSPSEYGFLLADVAIIAGMAAYQIARHLEAMADD